jgi:hypothetical protein
MRICRLNSRDEGEFLRDKFLWKNNKFFRFHMRPGVFSPAEWLPAFQEVLGQKSWSSQDQFTLINMTRETNWNGKINIWYFWVLMSCSLVYGYQSFVGTNCLHIQDRNIYAKLQTTIEYYSVSLHVRENVKSFVKKDNRWWSVRYITDIWQGYVKSKFEEHFLSYLGDSASEMEENLKCIPALIWFRLFSK